MRILFLTQVLPYPLDAGPKIRAYYVLRHLAERHQITLLSFVRQTDTTQAITHLEQFCERIVGVPIQRSRVKDGIALGRSLLSGKPFLITRDWIEEMDTRLGELLRSDKFDAIHADQLWMAPYALRGRQLSNPHGYKPYLVLDQHNAVHLIPQRMADNAGNLVLQWGYRREARQMARFEVETCQAFDHVAWVTHEDFMAVKLQQPANSELGSKTRNSIIPICIDPDSVKPGNRPSRPPILLFIGGMHWPPNAEGVRWFVKEVFPAVRFKARDTKLVIIGKSPPPDILGVDGVDAPGYVEDTEQYWSSAKIFIVPLKAGGGMRVKILEAWSHGLPIVSTSIGAEGIGYLNGKDLLIADDPHSFAEAIYSLILNDRISDQLAQEGRETVMQHYNWRTVYQAWDSIYS